MGSSIIICGKRYDIGTRVYTFEDDKGFNGYVPHRTDDISKVYAFDPAPGLKNRSTRYRERRQMGREKTLSRLQQVCRQVVVHLDGCPDARTCFNVLHNQRGLSCHFLCDNDGTIYQTLDLRECAFHAGGVNEISVGIELQNRGDAGRHKKAYGGQRGTVACRVHGASILAYEFTEPQYDAMIRLSRVLARVLRVPLTSPRAGSGELLWTKMEHAKRFEGFVGHYHISTNKWDPGPFDFRRLFRGVASRVVFPVSAAKDKGQGKLGAAAAAAGDLTSGSKRDIAAADKRFAQLSTSWIESAERDTEAHFPVGPLGQSRLWHGGVHLVAPEGRAIRAPLSGRLVVAKMRAPCSIGSCNFLVLRHRFEAGARAFDFYSLYYHLQREGDQWGEPAPWSGRNALAVRTLERGRIALLDDGVDAGELIGRVGVAGPSGHRKGQIHFAIFASEELGSAVDPGFWDVVEGSRSSRFCRHRDIVGRIDKPSAGKARDGMFSRRELRNFFQLDRKREDLRRMVVRYRAEWTPGDWASELARAPEFAKLSVSERQRLIAQQVKPTLWWTPRVARHAGLPRDGYVYAYHPLTFLSWYRKVLRNKAKVRASDIKSADRWEGKVAPKHLTVDAESGSGTTDEEDYFSGEVGKKLTLEDLVNGYPD